MTSGMRAVPLTEPLATGFRFDLISAMQVNGLGEKRKYLSFLRTSIFFIVHIVYLQFSGVFQENQVFFGRQLS